MRIDVARIDAPIEPYDLQAEIEAGIEIVSANTMVTRHRLAATYRLAAFAELAGVSGAFVECGTWKGGASAMMALANRAHSSSPRMLHLFDSFEDMCVPDERVDGALALEQARATPGAHGPFDGALRAMRGFYDPMGGHARPEDVRELMVDRIGYPASFVAIHEGWFQDTLPRVAASIGPIAVLRLDADFYAGTRFCLESLFGQVVDGGAIILDDYGCYDGCRRAVDEFLSSLATPRFLHHIDAEGRYFIK